MYIFFISKKKKQFPSFLYSFIFILQKDEFYSIYLIDLYFFIGYF